LIPAASSGSASVFIPSPEGRAAVARDRRIQRTRFPVKDKEEKKARRRAKRKLTSEQRSDRMAAADVAVRIEQVQEELADLLYEFRYLKRFSELEDVAFVTWRLDLLRERCSQFAEDGSWEKSE
jgi:hypothetical protein